MEFDWVCERPAFLDFETSSKDELKTVTKYVKHPSTQALCCVIKVDGTYHRFGPFLNADDYRRMAEVTNNRTIVAHNAPFDEAIWSVVCKLPPRKWYDTLPLCRASGLPAGLDAVGKVLFKRGKDPRGKQLIDMLCKGKQLPPATNPAYMLLIEYCARDVELLEQIFNHTQTFLERVKEMDAWRETDGYGCITRTINVDRKMNERGIPIDKEHLLKLKELYEENKEEKSHEFDAMTGGVNPNSPKQVVEWLYHHGFAAPGNSISKEAVRELLKNPEEHYYGDDNLADAVSFIREAIDLRREVSRVGFGKVEAALEMLDTDGRIRDCLVVYGAGPGRWASRGPQFHNMPNMMYDVDFHSVPLTMEGITKAAKEATVGALKRGGYPVNNADILSALIRHMVKGQFCTADYAAVELRGVMFFADDSRALSILGNPKESIYIDMGEGLFHRRVSKKDDPNEYTLCKTLVLGCIYGMSGMKFQLVLKNSSHSYGEMNVDPIAAVKTFRERYSQVPTLWKDVGCALLDCVTEGNAGAGRVVYTMHDGDMYCWLPSGRPIVYREARKEQVYPMYQKMYNLEQKLVDTVTYSNWRDCRAALWGSKQVENVVQGSCADLIAHATARADSEGLCPIFSVHDELVCETPDTNLAAFMKCMSEPPLWADGFPLLAEGYSGPVWTKQTKAKGFINYDFLLGNQL